MINIHLTNDEKFLNPFKIRFEKYHPDNNYYFIDVENFSKIKYFEFGKNNNVYTLPFEKNKVIEAIKECIKNKNGINIFIHFLDYKKARIVSELNKKFDFKTYWIFYGADLYNRLYKKDKYELYDKNNTKTLKDILKRKLRKGYYFLAEFQQEETVKKVINDLSYFCFWNPYDLELLRKNYRTKAEFKLFIYDSFGLENLPEFKEIDEEVITMVNHSASLSGNHLKILSKLNDEEIKSNLSKIIIPLNYGNKVIISQVDTYAKKNFEEKYQPLLKFIPANDYYNLLKSVDVAIFGHRRQEAGGNILYLIGCGAKIFLREDNSLLKYFKNLGISIFSFENDIDDKRDFAPLTLAQKKENRSIISKNFSGQAVDDMFRKLV